MKEVTVTQFDLLAARVATLELCIGGINATLDAMCKNAEATRKELADLIERVYEGDSK